MPPRSSESLPFLIVAFSLLSCMVVRVTADLPIPSAPFMVAKADIIAEGKFVKDQGLRFVPSRRLKGMSEGPWRVVGPPDGQFVFVQFAANPPLETVLVLGRQGRQPDILELAWLDFGIWPRRPSLPEFPSDDAAGCRIYVESMLDYERLFAHDPAELAQRLLRDFATPQNRPAVLGFVDAFLPSSSRFEEMRRDLLAVLAAKAAAQRPGPDRFSIYNLASLAPELPPSLALEMLATAATRSESPEGQSALTQGRAILRSRGLVGKHECQTAAELAEAVSRRLEVLRYEDARNLLRLFDSPTPAVRAAGNLVMETVVPQSLRGSPPPESVAVPEAAKIFWSAKLRPGAD